jgi:hypothetical protein
MLLMPPILRTACICLKIIRRDSLAILVCIFWASLASKFSWAFPPGDDIAHAEDAAGHAVGMEFFELIEFFADADKFDGRR